MSNTKHTVESIWAAIQARELQQGDMIETYTHTGHKDAKGREVIFARGHSEVLGTGYCFGWVQQARYVNGEYKDYGAIQPWRLFASKEAAKAWSLSTVKERAAKLN